MSGVSEGLSEGLLGDTSPARAGTGGVLAQISSRVRSCFLSDLEQDGQHWREWLTDEVIKCLPEEVKETIKADGHVRMLHFAGPAVMAIVPSTAVYWPFAILFPFAVCWVSSCPEGAQSFADYPIVVWVPVLVVIFFSMYLEWKGLKWIIYALARYLAPFKVFFGLRVNIFTWLIMEFGMSFITHLDVATNGLFLAKMLKTLYCDRPTTTSMRLLWERVIIGSSVKDVPGFKSLSVILLLSWGVMLFQPLVCFLCTYPLKGLSETNYDPVPVEDHHRHNHHHHHHHHHHRGGRGRGGRDHGTSGEPDGYDTPWLGSVRHSDALQEIASANRMMSITDKALQYWLVRGYQHLQSNGGDSRIRACAVLKNALQMNVRRFIMINLLEKSFMLEAQTTIFAVSRCLMPRDSEPRFDGQMLVSVCLSFITFTKTLYDMVDQFFMFLAYWRLARKEDNLTSSMAEEKVDALKLLKRKVGRLWLLFILTFLFLVGFFTHCLAKLIMAFMCEDSMWNIPFTHKPHQDWRGCVDVSDFLPP